MRFTPDFLALLREKVPLSQILARAVTWDRRKSQPGRGDFWGCCPFHQEKTPSFHVDDRKGFYHCFGCHASGDHLTFLTEHEGLDFPDAVKALAALAGEALPEPDRPEPAHVQTRRLERRALEAAAALFETTLWSGAGADARAYAHGRGFSEETLRAFGFGLAPAAAGALVRHLGREGFSEPTVEGAGLAVRRDGTLRDRFRARLMVPIHDARGGLVGFGGRTLEGREPKYLNSPQSDLFDKSTLLFNAHRARGPAHRSGRLVIVEGYLDAVALAEAGIAEAVASLGTALTEAQIARAWQIADEPVLCFDGDAAGRAAAHRAMDRIVPALAVGRSFQFVALPEGQDPDDLVRSGGRAAVERLLAKATPLVEAVFQREVERGTDTPERMAALEARLEAIAGSIADERVRRLYRAAFRERCFQLRRVATTSARPVPRSAAAGRAVPLPQPSGADRALLDLERIALGLLILQPSFLDAFGERLGDTMFVSEAHRAFAGLLLETYAQILPQDAAALIAALPERARLVLGEVWGAADDPVGARLLERFSILECEPDASFLARCMTLFLDRLALRAELAELRQEPERVAASGGGEARLLLLSAAVAAQRSHLQDEERLLADEAAALRKRRGARTQPKSVP